MWIRTISRCIILPDKYALNPKCCHWKQHGRPAGFSASFSGPYGICHMGPVCLARTSQQYQELGQGLLNVSFELLLGDSLLKLSNPEKNPSSSSREKNEQRGNAQRITYKHGCVDHHHNPVLSNPAQSSSQVFSEEGSRQKTLWGHSPSRPKNTEDKITQKIRRDVPILTSSLDICQANASPGQVTSTSKQIFAVLQAVWKCRRFSYLARAEITPQNAALHGALTPILWHLLTSLEPESKCDCRSQRAGSNEFASYSRQRKMKQGGGKKYKVLCSKSSISSKTGAPPPFLYLVCPKGESVRLYGQNIKMVIPGPAVSHLVLRATVDDLLSSWKGGYFSKLHFTDGEMRHRKGNILPTVTQQRFKCTQSDHGVCALNFRLHCLSYSKAHSSTAKRKNAHGPPVRGSTQRSLPKWACSLNLVWFSNADHERCFCKKPNSKYFRLCGQVWWVNSGTLPWR